VKTLCLIGVKNRGEVNGMSESRTKIEQLRRRRTMVAIMVLVIFAVYVAWLVFGAKVFG